jgi:hypothetical protein
LQWFHTPPAANPLAARLALGNEIQRLVTVRSFLVPFNKPL